MTGPLRHSISKMMNYVEAAQALNELLPGEVLEIEINPAQFRLSGNGWNLIVSCPWWLDSPEGRNVNYDRIETEDEIRIISPLLGTIATRFFYDSEDPRFAYLEFSNGWLLKFETESDYDPWRLIFSESELVAALSDFD